jgi:hypothetical protein
VLEHADRCVSSMQMVSVSLNFISLVITGSCCRIAVSDI